MKKLLTTAGRSALPVFAALALAFVLSQFTITASAGTVTTASTASPSSGPCDPSNCPMPCAQECTAVKSAACPAKMDCSNMKACKASAVQAASHTSVDCPTPCSAPCEKVAGTGNSKTVAQLK